MTSTERALLIERFGPVCDWTVATLVRAAQLIAKVRAEKDTQRGLHDKVQIGYYDTEPE